MTSSYKYVAPKKDVKANHFLSNILRFKLEALVQKNYNLLLPISLVIIIIVIAELLARAKRAHSGAPWVRKFGKLSI